jgi:hypothetical protein
MISFSWLVKAKEGEGKQRRRGGKGIERNTMTVGLLWRVLYLGGVGLRMREWERERGARRFWFP